MGASPGNLRQDRQAMSSLPAMTVMAALTATSTRAAPVEALKITVLVSNVSGDPRALAQ
jgi:hypothetical protein